MRNRREQSHPQTWSRLRDTVRDFRANPTPAEDMLWKALRSRPGGFKFRRQHAIRQYVVDFYCVEARMIVEVDGPIHEGQREQDQSRTDFLRTLDLEVLRFRNEDVLTDLRTVLARIEESCQQRIRNDLPSPRKERGRG